MVACTCSLHLQQGPLMGFGGPPPKPSVLPPHDMTKLSTARQRSLQPVKKQHATQDDWHIPVGKGRLASSSGG